MHFGNATLDGHKQQDGAWIACPQIEWESGWALRGPENQRGWKEALRALAGDARCWRFELVSQDQPQP